MKQQFSNLSAHDELNSKLADADFELMRLRAMNKLLADALRGIVDVHDMGGNEGPYANPDAVEHYLTVARNALKSVQS